MSNTTECPHCGRVLEARFIDNPLSSIGGRAQLPKILIGYEECGCEDAVSERNRAIERDAAAAVARTERDRLERYRKAGVKPRFLSADAECAEYVNDVLGGLGLYICGPIGTGKTHLASSIAKGLCDSLVNVRITSTLDILADIRSSFGTKSFDEDDVFRSLSKCGVLVIDDLGKEAPTEWVLSMLYRVVNDRYDNLKPMVVTSNYRKSELAKRLAGGGPAETSVAIVSRLSEMCRTVELSGADRRVSNV